MTFDEVKNIINGSDLMALRSGWSKEDTSISTVFIKMVNDAIAKRGMFGVSIKPFVVKSNPSDYSMEVYYPTEEDLSAIDWYIR